MSSDRINRVLDRDFFEYLLDLEVHRAVRYLYFFSLLVVQTNTNGGMVNSSQEESINETVSQLIRDEIRGTDIIGRIAKDRFFVMLHQADFQQVRAIGGRILFRITNYSFVDQPQEYRKVVNIGGACFPTHANDMDGLIAKSGEMLNQSEKEGKNKISFLD